MTDTWKTRLDIAEALEAHNWTGDDDNPLGLLRSNGATWAVINDCGDSSLTGPGDWTVDFPTDVPTAVVVEACLAAARTDVIPAWEAVYEPGNVSDYLVGYANDEAPAKAAAEAWLRSQRLDDETGRLEWVPDALCAVGEYDQWFELSEDCGDGIPTGPGLIVRHRAPAAVVSGSATTGQADR